MFLNKFFLSMLVSAALTIDSVTAYAVPSFGDIGRNQVDTFTGLAKATYYGALFGGIAMATAGLLQISAAHKKQESIKPGVIMLLVGAALSSITVVIGSGSATIFGADSSNTSRLGL